MVNKVQNWTVLLEIVGNSFPAWKAV